MTDWPLTFKCNNNCISCINNTEIFSSIPDPSLGQITKVIDKIDPKNDHFGLSGGEPTLRKEFFDILKYTRKKHPDLYIFIVTNARLFSYKKFAKKLADLKLDNFRVGVALYGHNKKIHGSITLSKNSFTQTVLGIKNLISFNIPVEIRIIINKLNYEYLKDISEFIVKEFPNVDRVVFINLKVTGNAYKNRNKVLVRISDVVADVKEATKNLIENEIETCLFHFPLCILPDELRVHAKGITKKEVHELTFVKECEKCKLKSECPKIWKSYVGIIGDREFKAII